MSNNLWREPSTGASCGRHTDHCNMLLWSWSRQISPVGVRLIRTVQRMSSVTCDAVQDKEHRGAVR